MSSFAINTLNLGGVLDCSELICLLAENFGESDCDREFSNSFILRTTSELLPPKELEMFILPLGLMEDMSMMLLIECGLSSSA